MLIILLYVGIYFYVKANKTSLIKDFTEQISDKVDGNLVVGDADVNVFSTFPKISVSLQNISLTDSLYPIHKHAIFEAKQVFATVNILKLLTKKQPLSGIKIVSGKVYLYTDTSGYTNTYLLKGKQKPLTDTTKQHQKLNIKSIELKGFTFILDDKKREKYHHFEISSLETEVDENDGNLVFNNNVNMLVKSLAFNLPKGIFLENTSFVSKFDMTINKIKNTLSFDSIDVSLGGNDFNFSGIFDLGDKNPEFTLHIYAPKILYAQVKTLLPDRLKKSLSIVDIDKPIFANARLEGPLKGGEPVILAKWKVENADMKTDFLDFKKASFEGYFYNEVVKGVDRKDPNSIIAIQNFKANWRNIPLTSNKIEILNLTTPTLTANLVSKFPLILLNETVKNNSLKFVGGDANIVLNYKGPVEKSDVTNAYLNGNVNFVNGTVLYSRRAVNISKINGQMLFENGDLNIKNLSANVVNTQIITNGSAKSLLTLINTAPNQVKISYNIYSPKINLKDFVYLLKKSGPSKPATTAKQGVGDMANNLDKIIEEGEVNVQLNADEVIYKNFTAQKLTANIDLTQDAYILDKVSMNTAGGSMTLSGKLLNVIQSDNLHTATLKTNFNNVDVKKILYSFNNFGQDGITSQNLEGILNATADVNLKLQNDAGVVPSSLYGKVDFSLKKGALNDFEPIKKIQKFIFKKRDFDNIQFAELKNTMLVKNGEITINRMEIQSSVLTLFVEGIYSTKGNTDLSIQVPLSNLKKRDDDYNPVNIGTEAKVGRSIFLRGRPGSDGKINIKLDLFKKFQKDKNIRADSTAQR